MKIKVLLVDDHVLVLQGIEQLLEHESEIQVVSSLSDPMLLREEIIRTTPDVIIIDIRMKSYNGIILTKKILEVFPQIKVVVLSGYDYDEYMIAAHQAGASAFVTKEKSNDELVIAIKQAYLGNQIFPEASNLTGETLTHKEREILQLIAEDKTNIEISDHLMISKRTIERHVSSIIQKLDADSRLGAVVNGIKQGLLNV